MSKKILVGILDWGLGHATRSIPLISHLLQFQCQIFIAASGQQRKILHEAFPSVKFLDPPPYAIHYPENGRNMQVAILKQIARLYKVVRAEEHWLTLQHRKYGFDLILSDNRYGFHHRGVHSVFITHQLSPRSGWGNFADFWLRKVHYRFIRRFNQCWVPDQEAGGGLAGDLSHPSVLPSNTRFIGPISRLEAPPRENGHSGPTLAIDRQTGFDDPQANLLFLISGPEPARTEFEIMLRNQLKGYKGRYVVVRGLPGSADQGYPHEMNHVEAVLLARLMANSTLVICRSGYTTIMDLLKMGKKAFLVPTPGQTEQEYLAGYLDSKGIFPFTEQSRFTLAAAITKSETYHYQVPDLDFGTYKKEVENLINR